MGRKPILGPSDLFLNLLNCSGDGWGALEHGSTSVARTILQLKADLERFRDNSTLKQALEVQIEELKETTSNVKKQLELELRNIERLKSQSVSVQIGEKEIASIEEIGRLFQRNRKETDQFLNGKCHCERLHDQRTRSLHDFECQGIMSFPMQVIHGCK